ncbi:MAG TPA: hypothetical protein VN033_08840 [Vulgatibacter sp.]|nr:hypothetical protein [Vulgatibacter sp.]
MSALPKCCRCGKEVSEWACERDGNACVLCVTAERDGLRDQLAELRREVELADSARERADESRRAAWARLDEARSALDTAGVPTSVDLPGGERRDLSIGERIDRLAEAQAELDQIRGPVCRVCGCSEFDPCEGGCGWADPTLCTECVGKEPETAAPPEEAKASSGHHDCECGMARIPADVMQCSTCETADRMAEVAAGKDAEIDRLRGALKGLIDRYDLMREHAPPGVALLASGWFEDAMDSFRAVLVSATPAPEREGGTR